MPGRKPPRRGETGNGFMASPRRGIERRRRTSPSSTTAASVVRSLAACVRAWVSNSSRNVNCRLHHNHRTTHFTEVHAVAQGVFSPRRVQRHGGTTERRSPRRAPRHDPAPWARAASSASA